MFQNEWTPFLKEEFQKPYFQQLSAFLRQQYATTKVYPPRLQVFSAFEFTNYSDVKVVILGQDPYHQPNQAHGMCFSVRKGVKVPPSLVNIYKELHDDLGLSLIHISKRQKRRSAGSNAPPDTINCRADHNGRLQCSSGSCCR